MKDNQTLRERARNAAKRLFPWANSAAKGQLCVERAWLAGHAAGKRDARNHVDWRLNHGLPICQTHGYGCGNDLATCRFAAKPVARGGELGHHR